MIKLKIPGMRTIKTLLVVSICFILSSLLNLNYPYYAVVAGVVCTQNTVHGSFSVAKNRIIGTILGSLLGILFVHLFSYNPWSSGIGILILLYFLKITKLEDAYRMACIVYLATFIPGHGDPITYGFYRTTTTIIGIVVALIVNLIVSPPQYSEDIKKFSYNLVSDLISSCGDFFILNQEVDLSRIGSEIFKIEALLKNYKLDIIKSNIETIDIDKLDSLIYDSKKIYNHLGMISELSEISSRFKLNEENTSSICKLYNQEIDIETYAENCQDDVLNYHIEKIIKYLNRIKDLKLN